MSKNILNEVSNFIKTNNDYSDLNIVDNLLYNLNFTKYRFNNNKQIGGNVNDPIIQQAIDAGVDEQLAIDAMEKAKTDLGIQGQQGFQDQQQNFIPKQEKYLFNNQYLEKPPFVTNEIKTYTIPKGTILYYGVKNKRGFNPENIDFGSYQISMLTPNFNLATSRIGVCDINNQKSYIHVFRVKQDIPNIYIKLPYDTNDDISLDLLYTEFCSGSKQYNGVGFFYHKNELEQFTNAFLNPMNQNEQNNNLFNSEFGLCNPTPYLEYEYTQKCQGLRQLSKEYRMDGKN